MQEYNIKPKRLKKEKEKAEEEVKAEETPEAVSETPSDPKE